METGIRVKNRVLEFADQDPRIRAVLLNGSRANPLVTPDELRDFDLVFLVNDLASFTGDHSWTSVFGEKLLEQLPDEMSGKTEEEIRTDGFMYLMLFREGYRIDLRLCPVEILQGDFRPDSLTIIWLDKDQLLPDLPPPSDRDYWIQKPNAKEFADLCNEFWWVSASITKSLSRKEIILAKQLLETVLRPALLRMIAWKVGLEKGFDRSMGKGYKWLKNQVSEEVYQRLLLTYTDAEPKHNWQALIGMAELFRETSGFVAGQFGFAMDQDQTDNAFNYILEQEENRETG